MPNPANSHKEQQEAEVEAEVEAEARSYAARLFDPHYHYVPDLSGWQDSDEECEARNLADDSKNMLEGD